MAGCSEWQENSAILASPTAAAQRFEVVKKRSIFLVIGVAAGIIVGGLTWAHATNRLWPPTAWPAEAAQLTQPELSLDKSLAVKRIYLDPGHGAEGNSGNLGALGQREQDFTLSLANDVGAILEKTGRFEVRICRQADELVSYADRVRQAETWSAHAFISLHSDVRTPVGVGYSVLWSDEGSTELVKSRLALARAMATQLSALGLPAYDGAEYGLYERDRQPGVFVDRHEPAKRIFVLRKPSIPSIIVETHNAKSAPEAKRWDEPAVRKAFAHALALAVSEL